MSIFRVEEYVRKQLEGTDVKIEVIKGHETLKKEYPCFAAVDRCANQLENQRGCVIWLTYEPKGKEFYRFGNVWLGFLAWDLLARGFWLGAFGLGLLVRGFWLRDSCLGLLAR